MSEKPTISTPNIDLDKNPQQVMSNKVPNMPKIPKPKKSVQVGVAPDSKKDPIKQAEQLKNKDAKSVAIKEAIVLSKNGQWSLTKTKEPMYHIHEDGYRITEEPVPHSHIVNTYGSIQALESKGFKLHPADNINKDDINKLDSATSMYKNNEQWSLEKQKLEFNPRKEQDTPGGQLRNKWVNNMSQEARDAIPKMEGAARTRAISRLAGDTQYRRNPHTNQVEFLMHRGVSADELSDNHNLKSNKTNYNIDDKNGWTPKIHIAHDFGIHGHDDGQKGHVVSAWVPEDFLHSSLRQYGSDDPDTQKMLSDEDEWIIHHKEPMHHESVVPADKNKIKPSTNIK